MPKAFNPITEEILEHPKNTTESNIFTADDQEFKHKYEEMKNKYINLLESRLDESKSQLDFNYKN
jgi:hypothetical protein